MKKVYQTIFGKNGNCQSAVMATLLGMDIEDVPYFFEGTDQDNKSYAENAIIFNDNFNTFLARYGLRSVALGQEVPHTEWVEEISREMKGVKLLVGGRSPRGHMHAVIYMDGKLWHDPHPSGLGVTPYHICFICPTFEHPM